MGPAVDLYSARKLVWEMTLWLRLGICAESRDVKDTRWEEAWQMGLHSGSAHSEKLGGD